MRPGTILAITALAALTVACSKPGGGGGGGAPTAPLSDADKQKLLVTLPAPYNTADIANGESKFALCQACHTLVSGGANMTGPNLYGIIGAEAGEGRDDFKFSDALKESHIVWTPDKLDAWIKKPQDLVPGSKMTFAGLDDAKDRTDVIAYLMVSTGYKPK